jgi:hypothetical protein
MWAIMQKLRIRETGTSVIAQGQGRLPQYSAGAREVY